MTEKAIEILRKYFGNHSEAAKALGITPRQYRRIRNKQGNMTDPLRNLINLKAKNIETGNENTREFDQSE